MASRKVASRNSLVVQWLRLHSFAAGGPGVILGWGAKILQAMQQVPKNKNREDKKEEQDGQNDAENESSLE